MFGRPDGGADAHPRRQMGMGRVFKKAVFARFLDRRPADSTASRIALRLPPQVESRASPRSSTPRMLPSEESDGASSEPEDALLQMPSSMNATAVSNRSRLAADESKQALRSASLGNDRSGGAPKQVQRPQVTAGPPAATAPSRPSTVLQERLQVGARVIVAVRGCEWDGVITTDDRSAQPFLVRFADGSVDWFTEEQVKAACGNEQRLSLGAGPSNQGDLLRSRSTPKSSFAAQSRIRDYTPPARVAASTRPAPTLLEQRATAAMEVKTSPRFQQKQNPQYESTNDDNEKPEHSLGQHLATLPEMEKLSSSKLQEAMMPGKLSSNCSTVSISSSHSTHTQRSVVTTATGWSATSTIYSSASAQARAQAARWQGRNVSPKGSRKDISAIAGALKLAPPNSRLSPSSPSLSLGSSKSPSRAADARKLVHASSLKDAWVRCGIAGREEVVFESAAAETSGADVRGASAREARTQIGAEWQHWSPYV